MTQHSDKSRGEGRKSDTAERKGEWLLDEPRLKCWRSRWFRLR